MKTKLFLFSMLAPLAVAMPSVAQDFPTKTVTIQVPWPAGGATDVAARALAIDLKSQWPQQTVMVENTAGAGGSIGTTKVLAAPGDGHSILVSSQQEIVFAPLNYQSANYKPQDFKAVAMLAYAPMMMAVRKDLPVNSLADLAKRLQSKEGKPLSYCTPGVGTIYHMVIEQISANLNLLNTHVPYPGFGQCLNDMAGGNVDFALIPVAGPFPGFVEKGVIRGLAVFSSKPSPKLPNLPLANATKGFENYNFELWSAVHVSNKVPDAVVNKIHAAVMSSLSKPELRKSLEAPGATVYEPMSPQQAQEFILKDAEAMQKMARLVGVAKK